MTKPNQVTTIENEDADVVRKRDALALAELLYDIYKDKKRKEKEENDEELSSSVG